MTTETCYKVGYIMKPHGLKGEVTISLDPEAPEDFHEIDTVFVGVGERLLPYFVESISIKGSKAYLKLEDVDSHETAQNISRSAIYLPKSSRPGSTQGEFYDDEVIGFAVEDTTVGGLGDVTEIVQAGPNKLLSVNAGGKEILIPLNGPFIDSIDKSGKRITVTLPDGFLEI